MSRSCPRLKQLKEKDNPEMREVCKKNEEILKYISENSGLNISCAEDANYYHQLTSLFDTLFVEVSMIEEGSSIQLLTLSIRIFTN